MNQRDSQLHGSVHRIDAHRPAIEQNFTRVRTLDTGQDITARAAGKMRRGRKIRIIPGDRVELEVSIYDPTKGRIVWRHK